MVDLKQIGIGVIGCGAWGANHLRVFSQLPEARLVAAADSDPERRAAVSRIYPGVEVLADAGQLLNREDIRAVVIATPTQAHHQLVKDALLAGKDVLVEKPLTITSEQSRELVQTARSAGRVLMVGHVFLFNPGVTYLKDYLQSGRLGRVLYFYAERTNLGPVRSDVNVIYDLASHDISILNYLLGSAPLAVNARGASYLQSGIDDVAFCTLEYPGQMIANLHVSWLHPSKVRQLTCVGAERMVVFNDLPSLGGPITIYEQKTPKLNYDDYGHFQWVVRQGDIHIPNISMTEPLREQAGAFLEAVGAGRAKIADGAFGAEVVEVLEALSESSRRRGELVTLGGAQTPVDNQTTKNDA